MGYALKYEQVLETASCCQCGIEFAAPVYWLKTKREEKGSLFCPNGHSLQFTGETAEQKIARIIREKETAELAKRFAEDRLALERVNHAKEIKRREKRSHAGVCQDCDRTFTNVARHMATKHGKK